MASIAATYSFDAGIVAALEAELRALGLWEHLEDEAVTDLMLNESGHLYLHTFEGTRGPLGPLEADRVESLIATIAGLHGKTVTEEKPILEATLPFHNVRVHALIPPVVYQPALILRVPPRRFLSLEDLVERGTMSAETAEELRRMVLERKTLIVCGGVGSGKTTLTSALLGAILDHDPDHRLCLLEEGARELQVRGANVNRLLTSPAAGITMRDLVRSALRMNPDRIVVGEARGPEAYDFLKACNTGHPGSLLTLHANSAAEAPYRLDSLMQEAGVPSQLERIREVVDAVVYMERVGAGRVVREVRCLRSGLNQLQVNCDGHHGCL